MAKTAAIQQSKTELQEQFAYMERVRTALAARYQHPPLALVRSFGCQANASDGELLRGMLSEMSYGFTEDASRADFIIFNTCAVRKSAEDRIFGNVGALRKEKRERPGLIIGLCGCMMQEKSAAAKIKESYPYVDLVFGTHAMHKFPQLLYRALTEKRRVFETGEEQVIAEGLPVRREGTAKAWVQIMYGCDNFCTYCIVPYVRGRERSRLQQHIVDEVRGLVENGCREITLLGQNVNSYGKGLEGQVSFSTLLLALNAIEGDFRIRFMTSHPKDCTPALIDTIARCEKVCRHIHLPVQSGSNRILKLMNRGYSREDYLALIAYARKKLPGVTFTSDIIVGFPTETYEDFQETLSLVQEVGYDALFTFIYSPREGTGAAKMDDPVPREEKSRWFQELQQAQCAVSTARNAALVGKTLRVLCEQGAQTAEGFLTGRTEGNAIVDFKAPPEYAGRFATVRITASRSWATQGELAEA